MACDVVVSVRAKTLEELHERAVLAAPEADLVELRIDALAAEQRSASECACAAEAIADACARPIVVACPGPEAFGAFLGSSAERIASLRPWLRSASWVDLDL
ncbi:MAG: type I 3-dehydroquinate dehydratase, partial [Planctomycetota bacterium]